MYRFAQSVLDAPSVSNTLIFQWSLALSYTSVNTDAPLTLATLAKLLTLAPLTEPTKTGVLTFPPLRVRGDKLVDQCDIFKSFPLSLTDDFWVSAFIRAEQVQVEHHLSTLRPSKRNLGDSSDGVARFAARLTHDTHKTAVRYFNFKVNSPKHFCTKIPVFSQ